MVKRIVFGYPHLANLSDWPLPRKRGLMSRIPTDRLLDVRDDR